MVPPPEMLMGEAGICGFWAMVAVAYVFQRNERMTGWQAPASDEARLAAAWWWVLPDETRGARFVFSFQDLQLKQVRAIVRGRGPPKLVRRCARGGLVFY